MMRFQSYQLFLLIKKDLDVDVGALGRHHFKAGVYVYTGSAKRNMEARIARHLKKRKTKRWHIDYLTTKRFVQIVEVRRFDEDECTVNQQTEGTVVVAGFGASDCKQGCVSHLKYLGPLPDDV